MDLSGISIVGIAGIAAYLYYISDGDITDIFHALTHHPLSSGDIAKFDGLDKVKLMNACRNGDTSACAKLHLEYDDEVSVEPREW